MTAFHLCTGVAVVVLLSTLCLYQTPKGANEERRRLTGTWVDPRTTVGKATSMVSSTGVESLRFAAFGTSKTWGAGLKDPNNEAYIKLISSNSVNLGLRATPADYPSLCLHSMVGDEQVFDVIILEFSPFGGPQHTDFDRLARRVRARFPTAIIIYLPIYMLLNDVSYQQESLIDYLRGVGVQSPKGLAFNPTIRHLVVSDMMFPPHGYRIADYEKTVNDIGGHIIEFPSRNQDLKSFVIDNVKYYTNEYQPWDFVHPSALGHQEIARRIRHKVMEVLSQQPPGINTGTVGRWLGGKDRCMSWFSGGNITEGITRIDKMALVNFSPGQGDGKWALEVAPHGGSLSVECLFPNCNIYISYMTKGPDREYPRVSLSLHHQEPRFVDPIGIKYHLRQMVHVGTLAAPGIATVTVKPHDYTTHRFRITGVITSPTPI